MLYARAGLSLADDLATLNRAPRISADPAAVAYVIRNLTFTGKPAHAAAHHPHHR